VSGPDARDAGAAWATSSAYRVSGPVPALFHEDPLFLELCAAFDELLGPVVTALDCFAAYLDPWLAPDDFLAWLGALVGLDAGTSDLSRALIADAVRGYQARGTAGGLRAVVAAATCVLPRQIHIAESGAVTWSDIPGAAVPPPFDPTVRITVAVPPGRDLDAVAACARAAAEPAIPVFSQLCIEVVET
jgi:phage tail-like protein